MNRPLNHSLLRAVGSFSVTLASGTLLYKIPCEHIHHNHSQISYKLVWLLACLASAILTVGGAVELYKHKSDARKVWATPFSATFRGSNLICSTTHIMSGMQIMYGKLYFIYGEHTIKILLAMMILLL